MPAAALIAWPWLLDPRVRREPWSTKEDRCLAELRVRHGANWSASAKEMKCLGPCCVRPAFGPFPKNFPSTNM